MGSKYEPGFWTVYWFTAIYRASCVYR